MSDCLNNNELVKQLRELPHLLFVQLGDYEKIVYQAADAIEELIAERDVFLTEMTREHNRAARLLWEKEHEMSPSAWIPVTERLPKNIEEDALVTDGEYCAVGYYRPDAQAWDSDTFGWLENRIIFEDVEYGIGTVTHWMPLPELPKEE